LTRLLPRLREHRKQDRRQDGNDGDDDQELYEGETRVGLRIAEFGLRIVRTPNTGARVGVAPRMLSAIPQSAIRIPQLPASVVRRHWSVVAPSFSNSSFSWR